MDTLQQHIDSATKSVNTDLDRLIAYAFWAGCHAGAKRVCDKHTQIVTAMRARANNHRYNILCNKIIGEGSAYGDVIYDPDYSSDFPGWEMSGSYPAKY